MTAKFGATSTTDDVLAGLDLKGKRVLVTGTSSGLGIETARALVAHGAYVVGTARDLDKAYAATGAVRAGRRHKRWFRTDRGRSRITRERQGLYRYIAVTGRAVRCSHRECGRHGNTVLTYGRWLRDSTWNQPFRPLCKPARAVVARRFARRCVVIRRSSNERH